MQERRDQPVRQHRQSARRVHIGSINTFFGLDTVSVYGFTKGAVAQLTKVMAVEWAKDNVQVNCVTPGFVATPLSKPVWADEFKANWLRSRIPVKRPCTPDELVGIILLLSSPASSYITGQNVVVDGGFLASGSWERDSACSPAKPFLWRYFSHFDYSCYTLEARNRAVPPHIRVEVSVIPWGAWS
jgi:NAD(P)-dependent dehydrogenase (short-subunit alcohol dehydrogenase family)